MVAAAIAGRKLPARGSEVIAVVPGPALRAPWIGATTVYTLRFSPGDFALITPPVKTGFTRAFRLLATPNSGELDEQIYKNGHGRFLSSSPAPARRT